MVRKPLRPLNVAGILDETFDLYKKHFLLFVGIAGILYVPLILLQYCLPLRGMLAPMYGWLTMPIYHMVTAVTAWAVSQTYMGNRVSIAQAYRAMGKQLFAFATTMILVSLIIGGGLLLLIVPGIIFYCRYIFVPAVFAVEGKCWGNARARSHELSKGESGRIIGLGLLGGIIDSVPSIALQCIISIASGHGLHPFSRAVLLMRGPLIGSAQAVVGSLTAPIPIIMLVLLYFDIRVRREGFDIEILTADLNADLPKASTKVETGIPS
jgi:hypothetical protein